MSVEQSDANPYQPTVSTGTATAKPSQFGRAVSHVLGILAFVLGSASGVIYLRLPAVNPIYLGAEALGRIIMVLLVLAAGSMLLSTVILVVAVRTKRYPLMLYCLPCLLYIGLLMLA